MKKLGLLVLPLMTISLLASCNQTPAPQVIEHFVTFESYGGDHIPTQRVKDGDTASRPEKTPVRGEDTFLGWFTDFEKEYTFTEKVTEDITLYAGWQVAPDPKTSHHFKFTGSNCNINGLSLFECDIAINDQAQFAIIPDDKYAFPIKDNEHFNVIKGSVEYDASKGLIKIGNMTSDIEIEAKSELAPVESHTVTFDANGGTLSGTSSIEVDDGNLFKDIANKPTASKEPTSAYAFAGWGLSEHTSDPISDTYEVTNSFTAYAIFNPVSTATIKLSDDSNNCNIFYNKVLYNAGSTFNIPAGTDVVMTVEPNEGYLPVFEGKLTFDGGYATDFNLVKQEIKVNVNANSTCTIKATTSLKKDTLDKYSWFEISQLSKMGLADEYFDIYDPSKPELSTKKVQLKHQSGDIYQTVRIIGFNEDYTELPIGGGDPDPDKAIGITFEFGDLISDASGYSLATYWNNTSEITNHYYKDSSIRKALTNNGGGDLNWFEKDEVEFSTDTKYANKSVLDMLPDELTEEGILKAPAKYINIWNDNLAPAAGWEEQVVNDKLFLLSPVEAGKTNHDNEEAHTTTYSYYKGDINDARIKHQIMWHENARTTPLEVNAGESTYKESYAGYNDSAENAGGISWFRSPETSHFSPAWIAKENGTIYGALVDSFAYAVAPAFCI